MKRKIYSLSDKIIGMVEHYSKEQNKTNSEFVETALSYYIINYLQAKNNLNPIPVTYLRK